MRARISRLLKSRTARSDALPTETPLKASVRRSSLAAMIVWLAVTVGIGFSAAQPAHAAPDLPQQPSITVPDLTIDAPAALESRRAADDNGDSTSADSKGDEGKASISLDLGELTGDKQKGKKRAGQSVTIILLLTLLAIAPALLMKIGRAHV